MNLRPRRECEKALESLTERIRVPTARSIIEKIRKGESQAALEQLGRYHRSLERRSDGADASEYALAAFVVWYWSVVSRDRPLSLRCRRRAVNALLDKRIRGRSRVQVALGWAWTSLSFFSVGEVENALELLDLCRNDRVRRSGLLRHADVRASLDAMLECAALNGAEPKKMSEYRRALCAGMVSRGREGCVRP